MKKIYSISMFIAAAAMTLASCSKEIEAPVNNETVRVYIGAEVVDALATKTTLTTEDDQVFTPKWIEGDEITLTYSGAASGTTTGTWDATEEAFAFDVDAATASMTGDWSYSVEYGAAGESTRTQTGNTMNGKYDRMTGTATTTNSLFAKDGDDKLVVDLDRQTAIMYFHISNPRCAIAEPITNAVLSATTAEGTSEIALNITDGVNMNATDGMQLWFNMTPGTYTALALTVETASYKFEIETNAEKTTTLTAGRLAKIVGTATSNYSLKEGTVNHGDCVFDSCDYSPYVSGVTVSGNPVLDTTDPKVGTGALRFEGTVGSGKLIGPFNFTRTTPLAVPEDLTAANGHVEFYLYTDKAITLSSSIVLYTEINTGGAADKGSYELRMTSGTLAAGWNKIDLPFYKFVAFTESNGRPDLTAGFNFFRTWISGQTAGDTYTIKIDNIRIYKDSNLSIFKQWPVGTTALCFKNTHPVFSADKKHAYVMSSNATSGLFGGAVLAMNIETNEIEWLYKPSASCTCRNLMVNPVNGDIYVGSSTAAYALTKDGELRWSQDSFNLLGSGLALNGDGSVVIIAGNYSAEGSSSSIWAVDATTGDVLSRITTGVCTCAQLCFVKEDTDYEYIAFAGNTTQQFYKLNKSTGELTTAGDSVDVTGKVSDITSPAVNAAKTEAYFPDQSGNIHVVDIENMSFKGYMKASTALVSGIVFDASGNMYVSSSSTIYKYAQDIITVSSSVPSAAQTSTFAATIGTGSNAFNYLCPSVTENGYVYATPANSGWGSVVRVSANATGTTSMTAAYANPMSTGTGAGFQGVFAMTDGNIVVGLNGAAGYVYDRKVSDTIASNTWGYYGGDPCATKNVKWTYGSY